MPLDATIKSVLVIGSGPIVIGQACEFDYSGTQACRVLRAEGIRVILVNSNPATIMTDPEFADATYIEPITPEIIERIIAHEKPDAVLATLGGQTALNAAIGLYQRGTLAKYGVRLIGADVDAINRGENRELFRAIVEKVGGESAKSRICHTMEEILDAVVELNYQLLLDLHLLWVDWDRELLLTKRSYARSPGLVYDTALPLRFFLRNQSLVGKSMN